MFDFCEVPIWRSPCFGFTKYNTLYRQKQGTFKIPFTSIFIMFLPRVLTRGMQIGHARSGPIGA